MPLKFQHPFDNEQAARQFASTTYPTTRVQIIESRGQFYVEDVEECAFLRSWERECYVGIGRNAVPKEIR